MRFDRKTAYAMRILLAVAAPLVTSHAVAAQALKYTSTTTMELGGALGSVASMIPGLGDPVRETTYIKGTFIRSDIDERSTIMDWSGGDVLEIDHMTQSYMRFNLLEMTEAMAAAMQEGVAVEPEPAATEEDERAEPQFEVRFSIERSGLVETVGGYEAEQAIVVLEIVPTEAAAEMQDEEAGELAVVTELWLSTDFPEYEMMREMQEEAWERFQESGAGSNMAQSMEGLESFDPRLGEAWQENLEAMKELEGTALRSTVHFVTVPPGLELDSEKVLTEADQGLGSEVAGAARESVRDAARSALGRFGRRREEPEEPAPMQSVFMRIVTEIGEVETRVLEDAVFQVPEGYTEASPEPPIGR